MTDIEQKALALVNEACRADFKDLGLTYRNNILDALILAIEQLEAEKAARAADREQHEAFRQEVSDAVEFAVQHPASVTRERLSRFIIAKPDPLVEALDEALWEVSNVKLTDRELRAVSLRLNAKRGGKIVWGEG